MTSQVDITINKTIVDILEGVDNTQRLLWRELRSESPVTMLVHTMLWNRSDTLFVEFPIVPAGPVPTILGALLDFDAFTPRD